MPAPAWGFGAQPCQQLAHVAPGRLVVGTQLLQHLGRKLAIGYQLDRRRRIECRQLGFDPRQLLAIHQIALAHHQQIRQRHLFHRLILGRQLLLDMTGIHHGDSAIEAVALSDKALFLNVKSTGPDRRGQWSR